MNTSHLFISGIYIYPIKSCKGISLQSAFADVRGFAFDRRWMVVDRDGIFMTQRNFPSMSLIETKITQDTLYVTAPEMNILEISHSISGEKTTSIIWNDTVQTIYSGKTASEWFSQFLHTECSLVFQPDESRRAVDARYAHHGEHTSLSDGFPFLIISDESLNHLNAKLEQPVLMNRFRPNITIAGGSPFQEDQWRTIQIRNSSFHLVKPCARCTITTVDQYTGVQGKEPLRTLSTFRTKENMVLFGQNALADISEIIAVGDIITIIEQLRVLKYP